MLQHIKTGIQNIKIEQCRKKFAAEVERQSDRYTQWILQKEGKEASAGAGAGDGKTAVFGSKGRAAFAAVIPYDRAGTRPLADEPAEILLFVDEEAGHMGDGCLSRIQTIFSEHEDWDLVYGDEDYCYEQYRIAPWMKPEWSPDTLMAFPYIGHFFALRKKRYESVEWLSQGEPELRIYDFLLKCSEQDGRIVHVPQVMFHNAITKEQYEAYRALDQDDPRVMTSDRAMPWVAELSRLWGNEEVSAVSAIRQEAMKRRGVPGRIERDEKGVWQPVYEVLPNASGKMPLVSIIIPSKDNPEILERCLLSIQEHSAYPEYEIVIVDNGSSGANRARIMNLEKKVHFRYFYRPMEFNFSAMVNLGAGQAKGDYFLLLNDDCEVLQDDWLFRLMGQAQLPHVGAVGAKLLYPNTDLIQHAGITNMTVGPAHKLQEEPDAVSYYYGRNRFNYNCIGVTAACLLTAREKYERAGGFDETLRVAYNDVDFCFTQLEQGLFHVIRNDVVLYHHESLSRGNDLLSDEKVERLMEERKRIYEKHPRFRGRDPFYSENLLGNAVDYIVNYRYDYELDDAYTGIAPGPEVIPQEWYNDSILITVEQCCKKRFFEVTAKEEAYLIEGWAYVLSQDNCRYEMALLLKREDGDTWLTAEVFRRYRPDVAKVLTEQRHVELSGFVARLHGKALEPGSYRVYLLMKDSCSRQRLLKDTGAVLAAD